MFFMHDWRLDPFPCFPHGGGWEEARVEGEQSITHIFLVMQHDIVCFELNCSDYEYIVSCVYNCVIYATCEMNLDTDKS